MNKKLATLLFAIGLGASASAFAWQDIEACVRGCGEVLTGCLQANPTVEGGDKCWREFSECRDWCGF